MAKTPTRAPVTQRGIELLALIAGAPNGILMLTQEEGLDAVSAGHAVVDTATVDGNTAAVSLTDAGRAALAGNGGSATKFAIRSNVALPETASQRRGRQSSYPFEMLEIGQSFHVPLEAGQSADALAAKMASSVSGARARFAVDTGETKTVTVSDYQRDENGFVKDADGKRIVTGTREIERPVKTNTRDFKLAVVDNTDPDGPGVAIWRTA